MFMEDRPHLLAECQLRVLVALPLNQLQRWPKCDTQHLPSWLRLFQIQMRKSTGTTTIHIPNGHIGVDEEPGVLTHVETLGEP